MRTRQEFGLPIEDLVEAQARDLEWQESQVRARGHITSLCCVVSACAGFLLAVFLPCL